MGATAQLQEGMDQRRVPRLLWILSLALGLNVMAWVGASLQPGIHKTWTLVCLPGFFVLGLVIGRWWALLVTCSFAVIHAVPVYLGWLPGYLSNWGEALWWAFGMAILVTLTGFGVLVRKAISWVRRRAVTH
jgi:hypothetical protein